MKLKTIEVIVNRQYTNYSMNKAINEYRKDIDQKRALGELGCSKDIYVNFEQVSHMIEDIRYEDNIITCDITVMDLSYTLVGDDEPRQESVVMEIKEMSD